MLFYEYLIMADPDSEEDLVGLMNRYRPGQQAPGKEDIAALARGVRFLQSLIRRYEDGTPWTQREAQEMEDYLQEFRFKVVDRSLAATDDAAAAAENAPIAVENVRLVQTWGRGANGLVGQALHSLLRHVDAENAKRTSK